MVLPPIFYDSLLTTSKINSFRFYTSLLIVLLSVSILSAQDKIIRGKDSSTQINIHNKTSFASQEVDLTLIDQQLVRAKQLLFKESIDSARQVLNQLIDELASKNVLESSEGLEARFLQASISELNNDRGEALEKIFSLIESCKAQEEWLTLSRIYLVTELAYEFLQKPDRCLYYLNQCRALIIKHDLDITYPRFCIRLSTFHRIFGDRDSSFYYAEEALRSGKEWYDAQNGDFNKEKYEDLTPSYATSHLILGGLYSEKGDSERSNYHNIQVKNIWQKAGNDYDISWAFLRMSWFHNGQDDKEKALLYNDSSMIYGQRVFEEWGILGKGLKSHVMLGRAGLFRNLNQLDSANYFLNQGYQAKIDVTNARNHLYATEIEARFTDKEKALKIEQQSDQLKSERKWRIGLLSAIAMFLILVIGLVYYYLQMKKANKKNRLQAKELKQLDKVKSKFFTNISHELRTPLTLILGPLSYILDNPDEWEKENIQKQLSVMQRNGKSLMDLIEEILDLSKLEANKLEINEEGTPVTQFFERLFYVFEPQFKSQNLTCELNIKVKEGLNVLMDRKKMEKVMNNFLSNAIKFTPKYGKVSLSIIETDNYLKIKVSDTGKGVHPRDLPHIFDRFYQSGQADQKLYGGTGIGLALVNEFAQLMGGNAHAESKLGLGSKFFFELPKKIIASQTMLTSSEEQMPNEEIFSIGNDFTILVVEDNLDMREFVCHLLQKKYKRVLVAKNGVEGLTLLKKHGPNIHLIVSDVMMPEVDGLTMLKLVKQEPVWSGIPVIMLTALAAERDKMTALTVGVDDYLTKPFSVPELLIRVQNLLYNYHQRKEWKNSDEFKEQKNAPQIEINTKDKEWIDKITLFVQNAINDPHLNVTSMASAFFLSTRQFNRKLKAITGLSPAKFIKEVRLQAALNKLEVGTAISVTEVAREVGFDNISTFSFVFKNRFGKSPRDYMRLTKM